MQEPYKLPEGWRWVRLGEVCIINPRRPRIQREPDEPTTFVPMTAIDEQTGTIVAAEVHPFEEVKRGYTYFEENDVLFAKITPCMENGKAAIARGLLSGIGFGSTEFHVLRPDTSVVPEWIWLFIRRERFREDAKKAFRGGVGQQRVPQEFLEQYFIPLPPLEEQKRIVARIEELMGRVREARRLREEARNDAERLWQAILAQTFPRPGSELPEGWRWAKLGEVCDVERKTLDPRRFPEKEFFVYSIPAYDKNESPELLKGAEIGSAKLVIEPGVCLFSKLNPRIPRAWAIREDPPVPNTTLLASTEFMPLRPHSQLLDLEYLRTLLLSDIFLNQVRTDVTGATGSRQRLRTEIVLDAFIPLPPLEEQRRIVAHLQEVQEKTKALKEAQEQTEAELKRLEQAILEKAFRGEL